MSCQAIQLRKTWQEAMIRVLAPAGPARCLLWATRLVSHWWTMTSLVSHWWTMTSTHKAWRAGHAIKVDVGGAGFQIERDKMAESRPKPVTFDRALQREQARQKRHRQGGKQQELSHRLDQQAEIPAVPAKRKKTPAKETFLKDSAVLHTLGPARPASPSKEVASMLSSLRPPPSPYGTPPDLPSTLEELLEQVPECAEGPPLEEVQEEKKKTRLPGIFHPHHPTGTTPRLRKGCLICRVIWTRSHLRL